MDNTLSAKRFLGPDYDSHLDPDLQIQPIAQRATKLPETITKTAEYTPYSEELKDLISQILPVIKEVKGGYDLSRIDFNKLESAERKDLGIIAKTFGIQQKKLEIITQMEAEYNSSTDSNSQRPLNTPEERISYLKSHLKEKLPQLSDDQILRIAEFIESIIPSISSNLYNYVMDIGSLNFTIKSISDSVQTYIEVYDISKFTQNESYLARASQIINIGNKALDASEWSDEQQKLRSIPEIETARSDIADIHKFLSDVLNAEEPFKNQISSLLRLLEIQNLLNDISPRDGTNDEVQISNLKTLTAAAIEKVNITFNNEAQFIGSATEIAGMSKVPPEAIEAIELLKDPTILLQANNALHSALRTISIPYIQNRIKAEIKDVESRLEILAKRTVERLDKNIINEVPTNTEVTPVVETKSQKEILIERTNGDIKILNDWFSNFTNSSKDNVPVEVNEALARLLTTPPGIIEIDIAPLVNIVATLIKQLRSTVPEEEVVTATRVQEMPVVNTDATTTTEVPELNGKNEIIESDSIENGEHIFTLPGLTLSIQREGEKIRAKKKSIDKGVMLKTITTYEQLNTATNPFINYDGGVLLDTFDQIFVLDSGRNATTYFVVEIEGKLSLLKVPNQADVGKISRFIIANKGNKNSIPTVIKSILQA